MSLQDTNPHATLATFGGAATSLTVWGLHLGDFAVMVSAIAAVCGAVIQVLSYLDRRAAARKVVETDQHGKAD